MGLKALASFVVRYYYCLKDDTEPNQALAEIFGQHAYTAVTAKTSPDFTDPAGLYFELADNTSKLAILAVKTPTDPGDWTAGLKSLQGLEKESAIDDDDLMGKLTLLVTWADKPAEYLQTAVPFLPCREVKWPAGAGPLFRLPIDKKDSEAVYVYHAPAPESLPSPLLSRRLPNLHAQLLYLSELNAVLRDRENTIGLEKEGLSKDLIQTLHTKLVMNQHSLDVNRELENDVEKLATGFAKLVTDKKLIRDGLKRLESMLKGAERQFLNEPAMGLDKAAVDVILAPYHNRTQNLHQLFEELKTVEQNYQSAIEVVQSKTQVINSRTNMETQEQIRELLNINVEMQKQGLVFQYAAGLIEFIILAYYSLSIWTNVSPVAAAVIPGWVKLVFVFVFSGTTVVATHYLAEFLQGDAHVRRKLFIVGLVLVLILLVILVGTWSANLTPGIQPTAPAH